MRSVEVGAFNRARVPLARPGVMDQSRTEVDSMPCLETGILVGFSDSLLRAAMIEVEERNGFVCVFKVSLLLTMSLLAA